MTSSEDSPRGADSSNSTKVDLPAFTAAHDNDLAYWQSHVETTRRETLNAAEWPELDAEIVRIKEIRALVCYAFAETLSDCHPANTGIG